MIRTLIVGAGLAGLNCAEALGRGCRLVEREGRPGGLCRTERAGGFTIDHTGHYLHFRDAGIQRQVRRLLGGNMVEARRDSWFHARGVMTPAPIQANIHGHDPAVVRECIVEFMKARERTGAKPRNYAEWFSAAFGRG
ncbi:MAG: NAD(P)-binding protein, partial [bacterium]